MFDLREYVSSGITCEFELEYDPRAMQLQLASLPFACAWIWSRAARKNEWASIIAQAISSD